MSETLTKMQVLRRLRDEAQPNTEEKVALRWALEIIETLQGKLK